MMSILAMYAVGIYLSKHRNTTSCTHTLTRTDRHPSPSISIQRKFTHQEDENTIRGDIVMLESFGTRYVGGL